MESDNTTNLANGGQTPIPRQVFHQNFYGPVGSNQVGNNNAATPQPISEPRDEAKPPAENTGVSIKRKRDIESLKVILSQLHRSNTSAFLREASAGYMLDSFATHYWEGFIAVLMDSNFHLYDKETYELLCDFAGPVQGMTDIAGRWMHYTSTRLKLTFGERLEDLTAPGFHEAIKEYANLYRQAQVAYERLYDYLRENYLEIDFDETDAAAAADYRKYHED